MHLGAEALADPVLLHGPDLFRPAGQLVQVGEQFLGVGGDLHEIHRDLALFHRRAGAPAAAVDHLLVGEHGHVHRIPVHRGEFFVDQALLEQLGEQPLLPLVVVRLAGGQLARPVDGQAEALELPAHVVDVGVGPCRRRHVVLDCRVFRRQAESVPAHRLQHVVALETVVAGQHVADGVVAHVPHVQLAGGIGEHRQAIVFGLAGSFHGLEGVALIPESLGLTLDLGG
jgi:hypothetical protein